MLHILSLENQDTDARFQNLKTLEPEQKNALSIFEHILILLSRIFFSDYFDHNDILLNVWVM